MKRSLTVRGRVLYVDDRLALRLPQEVRLPDDLAAQLRRAGAPMGVSVTITIEPEREDDSHG